MEPATPPPAATPSPAAPPVSASPATTSTEDKTVAILSYLTLLGFIAAVIIHSSKKTQLGTFHLRQALGIFLTWVAVGFCGIILAFIPILGWLAIIALWFCMFALLIMGLISAAKGEMKPLPVVGEKYQKWFGTAFN